MAALSMDGRIPRLEIVFKSRATAELDLLLEGSQLLVNDKWLDFHASHNDAPCGLSRVAAALNTNIDTFSCDHVIMGLYDLFLLELIKDRDSDQNALRERDSSLRLGVSENLRQMPRMIQIARGDHAGEISVTWTDSECGLLAKLHQLDLKCRVTLHRESTCSHKRFDLVVPEGKLTPLLRV